MEFMLFQKKKLAEADPVKMEQNRRLVLLLAITLRVMREASPLTLSDQGLSPWTRP